MHFRSATRDAVTASYPVVPYSTAMYSGDYGWSLSSFLGLAESQGFYADTGGYGWYYNADTNKSIDLVFAPGGGQRITYYETDPSYKAIFNKVVKGKNPVGDKEELKALAEKAGGKETTGKAVASSSAAGAQQETRSTKAAGGTPATEGGEDDGKKLWEKPWFLPAVGALTLATVAAIAFWPTKTTPPVRTNGKNRSSTRKRSR